MSDELLANAVGAITNRTVVTYETYLASSDKTNYEELGVEAFHKVNLNTAIVPSSSKLELWGPQESKDDLDVNGVFVKTLTGKEIKFPFKGCDTILDFKRTIEERIGIPVDQQRLAFGGKQLEDFKTRSDYNIQNDDRVDINMRMKGGKDQIFYLPKFFREKTYDYDFTNILDKEKFSRGDHDYTRSCGWNRIALNVKKYGDGDPTWLGTNKAGDHNSATGEWPVAYNGTGEPIVPRQ